jgi:hypothetical protein
LLLNAAIAASRVSAVPLSVAIAGNSWSAQNHQLPVGAYDSL